MIRVDGCDNILSGCLCAVTTVFSQQDRIYGFKFPKTWWPYDDGGRHGRRVHGLARVAYVGQRFRCPP